MFSIRGLLFLAVFFYCAIKSFREPKHGYFLILVLLLTKPLLFELIPEVFLDLHAPLVLGIVVLLGCIFSGAFSTLDRRAFVIFIFLTFFIVACWLSRVGDPDGVTAHKYIGEVTNMWLLFLVGVATVRTSRDLRELHLVFMVTIVVLGIVSYWHYRIDWWEMPLPARNVDRNQFSLTLAAFVPIFLLVVVLAKRRLFKYLAVFSIMLIIVCVIPSYSRGAFLSLMIAFVLGTKLMPNKKLYVIILALALGVGALKVSDSYIERLSSSADYEEEASAAGRVATYYAAFSMFQSAPLMGVGVGNFNDYFWGYCPEQYRVFCMPGKSVHNLYLQVLSETGLMGMIPFLLFILSMLKMLVPMLLPGKGPQCRHDKTCYAFGASFLVLLLGYLLLPGAYNSFIYPLGASFVSAKLVKPDAEASQC